MGEKYGKYKKKEDRVPTNKNKTQFDSDNEDMMNDEIDVFHKNRDVIPLNVDDDVEESDEDIKQPVLDFEDVEAEEDEDLDDDEPPKGFIAQIKRTQKYLRSKIGDIEDEMLDDADEEEETRVVWGKKSDMYGADVNEIRGQDSVRKGGMHYTEVKQILLQSFCQAIAFYLLLKSEGQPVRDHPVVSHLVEIRSLLDKIKEMDESLSFNMEDILQKDLNNAEVIKSVEKTSRVEFDSLNNNQELPIVTFAAQATVEPNEEVELHSLKSSDIKRPQHKHQDKQVGPQSMEMLKIRASLEEKLKQQGVFSSIAPNVILFKQCKKWHTVFYRQLETSDDFVDEAMVIDALANGRSNVDANQPRSSKISQQLTLRPNKRKRPSRDTI